MLPCSEILTSKMLYADVLHFQPQRDITGHDELQLNSMRPPWEAPIVLHTMGITQARPRDQPPGRDSTRR
jgi:hypothetical protein